MALLQASTLDALRTQLETFLEGPALFSLEAIRFQPVGLGGYLGLSQQEGQYGDISGLRLDARILFDFKQDSDAARIAAADAVDTALLGQEVATLRENGFFKLEPVGRKAGDDNLQLIYHTLFEFRQLPEQDAESITNVVVSTAPGSEDGRPLREILNTHPHKEGFNIQPD
jgi:hypothetical protein